MSKRRLVSAGLALAFLVFLGCASMVQENWGKSYRSMKVRQILNPLTEENLEPVTGLDGEVAAESMKKYRKQVENQE